MPINFQGRSLLGLADYTPEEINYLIDLGQQFKNLKNTRTPHKYLEGKNIVLLFEKNINKNKMFF